MRFLSTWSQVEQPVFRCHVCFLSLLILLSPINFCDEELMFKTSVIPYFLNPFKILAEKWKTTQLHLFKDTLQNKTLPEYIRIYLYFPIRCKNWFAIIFGNLIATRKLNLLKELFATISDEFLCYHQTPHQIFYFCFCLFGSALVARWNLIKWYFWREVNYVITVSLSSG